jgi:hypothetical protein
VEVRSAVVDARYRGKDATESLEVKITPVFEERKLLSYELKVSYLAYDGSLIKTLSHNLSSRALSQIGDY